MMHHTEGRTYVLEIGVEEMPAGIIPEKEKELNMLMASFLTKQRLAFTTVKVYSTPRRLAVMVMGLADRQEDLIEVLRGPRKKVALNADGTWTQAAKGFAASRGLDLDTLYFEGEGEDAVLTGERHSTGQPVETVLLSIPEAVIASLTFPKAMRWGTDKTRFIRPIRWLVSLLDDTVLPIRFAGLEASRISYGHRFLGEKIVLSHARDYETALRDQFVLVDRDLRKATIIQQIEDLSRLHEAHVPIDPDLLEEVTDLVEWPTAFWGTFDEQYLQLPREVLMLTMKMHQRYFYVEDASGALLPFFVGVRNGDSHHLATVVRGNEKVLSARLADARFFYEEDLKGSVDEYVTKLDSLTFHARLGSMLDKTRRLVRLADLFADRLGMDTHFQKKLQRAASIAKFDLVTHMVYEFPELEGTMGEVYARLLGEEPEVAASVREHTYPRGMEGPLPASQLGAFLALIDKIDTLVSFFAIDEVPSGSEDPYALRRALNGVIQMLDRYQIPLSLAEVWTHAYNTLAQQQKEADLLPLEDVLDTLWTFTVPRLMSHLEQKGLPHDIAQALVYRPTLTVFEMIARGKALHTLLKTAPIRYRQLVQALIRSMRLGKKLDHAPFKKYQNTEHNEDWMSAIIHHVALQNDLSLIRWEEVDLEASLLQEPQEKRLLQAVKSLFHDERLIRYLFGHIKRQETHSDDHLVFTETFEQASQVALSALEHLVQPIEQFFDAILVMSEDRALREARLTLLNLIAFFAYSFADFEAIVLGD